MAILYGLGWVGICEKYMGMLEIDSEKINLVIMGAARIENFVKVMTFIYSCLS